MKIKENEFLLYVVDYLAAILFTNTDDNDEPLDANYGTWDFESAFYAQCRDDLAEFFELADVENLIMPTEYASAAHDLWMTRSGQGCGFWDGDWKTENDPERGEKLYRIVSEHFQNIDVYVTDEGQISGIF